MTDLFVPKPFAEITADMVEHVRGATDKLTDFNVGSVLRTVLEANATELDDYYQSVYLGLLKAIPTAIYIGFGFAIKPAVAASGVVAFTLAAPLAEDLAIAQGTRLVSKSGNYYVTAEDVSIPAGETSVSVACTAEIAGASGNDDPNALELSADAGFGTVLSATNPSSMTGGENEESEEQRAERFAAFIRALARGTPAALEYAATLPALYHPVTGVLSERVQRSAVEETPGHVMLYIHNGSAGASDALVAAVQTLIDGYRDEDTGSWIGGYRPAGMRVEVAVMVDTPVNVSLEIGKRPSYAQSEVTNGVRGALERLLRDAVAGDVVRPIDLVNAALGVDGVTSVTVLSPTASIAVQSNDILYLDGLTLSWVE